jgi:hypothetical protein
MCDGHHFCQSTEHRDRNSKIYPIRRTRHVCEGSCSAPKEAHDAPSSVVAAVAEE